MTIINRTEASRALAKAIAYKQCGQDALACQWAYRLVNLLQCADILDPGSDAAVREYEARLGLAP